MRFGGQQHGWAPPLSFPKFQDDRVQGMSGSLSFQQTPNPSGSLLVQSHKENCPALSPEPTRPEYCYIHINLTASASW